MPELYGKKYTKEELLKHIGDVSQIGGARLFEYSEGAAKGIRACEIKTGSGFQFTVLPERGLDISECSFQGRSLCWRSPTGDTHPSYFNDIGMRFLRNFFGGLVATCGLTTAGSPSVDEGEELGLHGRISNTPAYNVSVDGEWDGDDYVMWVQGKAREARVFGENLELTRKISTKLGTNSLKIEDKVKNLGYKDTPLMILYHINLGFPVIDKNSVMISPSTEIIPRDDEAKKGLSRVRQFPAPVKDYDEQVFYHTVKADKNGIVPIGMVNGKKDFGCYIKYNNTELPKLIQWKMTGEGTYVVGVEPANCLVEGRDKERERGTLQFIAPGETRSFSVEIGVLENADEVDDFEKMVGGII